MSGMTVIDEYSIRNLLSNVANLTNKNVADVGEFVKKTNNQNNIYTPALVAVWRSW